MYSSASLETVLLFVRGEIFLQTDFSEFHMSHVFSLGVNLPVCQLR